MTELRFDEQACRQVMARLDAYVDGELETGAGLEIDGHLRTCAACAAEAEARRAARERLRLAVREVRIPAGLEDRIRVTLRGQNEAANWSRHLMAIAAALAVCVGSWLSYRFVESKPGPLMRAALENHVRCAVSRTYPPEGLPAAMLALPAPFDRVEPAIEQSVGGDMALVIAHECRLHGRRFVHLTFNKDTQLLSVIFVRKEDGESLSGARLLPALTRSGVPLYTDGVQRFQLAAFESRDYLVYAISDLTPGKNLGLLADMAPALQSFLRGIQAS